MISAVIVSYNEATSLQNCLESIKDFAGEIIVVDLGSEDKTMEICKRYGVKVFKHKLVPFVEEVRNFAISKAEGEWLLVLDPDEEISEGLGEQLKKVIKDQQYRGVSIPRKNIFFGKWIRHSNWWPDRHIRFFKKGSVKWNTRIHSYPDTDGSILVLDAKENLAIIHKGYDSIKDFIDRQNRYSDVEAKQRFEKGERFSWIKLVWWPSREFLVRFIRHTGFLDGLHGLVLTCLMMIYQVMVLVKMWEEKNL